MNISSLKRPQRAIPEPRFKTALRYCYMRRPLFAGLLLSF